MLMSIKGATRQQVRRLGRAVYWRLPPRWRDAAVDLAFRAAGGFFRGFGRYELWRQQREDASGVVGSGSRGAMIDLAAVAPLTRPPGSIAIHAHVYYPELAEEFATCFAAMPFAYDLYVSVADEQGLAACRKAFAALPKRDQLQVEIVPNRGRDIAPMLCAFGARLQGYDFIAHVHSKKSEYNQGATRGWRPYLLDSLFGSEDRLKRIFSLLDSGAGIVFPQCFADVPYVASSWLANRATAAAWCHRLGIRRFPGGYFDFPVGSMFWARSEALRPLFAAGVTLEDFESELGQTDGTLAHAVERLIGVVARDSGQPVAILRDEASPSWSPWRFEQFVRRDASVYKAVVGASDLRMVVFDIFDTLLVRPLVEPERVKTIVARRAGGALGEAYLTWRATAEVQARSRAGRDVGLTEIGAELGRIAKLDDSQVAGLIRLEEEVECALVSPRAGAVELCELALRAGKRVVFASDMYLSSAVIARMLTQSGIEGWHGLYVSCEIGVRKDGGGLFDHVLGAEQMRAGQVLMVGDNERSDFQIPLDRGMRTLHVLRAVELARGQQRLSRLLEEVEQDASADTNLGLGLLVRKYFSPLIFERFDPYGLVPRNDAHALGYTIAGPLSLAFAQWLMRRAREDGVSRLYFLAREGQFLKQVYDVAAEAQVDAPEASYLVVSRRAVNVPAIRDIDDVLDIASGYFGPSSLAEYLQERFGLPADEAMLQELHAGGLWSRNAQVVVRDGEIGHLKRLLEALLPRILDQARTELPGIEAYLAEQRIDASGACAVVDIGYSGTIQRRLNRLLGGGVHGYYMATDERIDSLPQAWGVIAQGCFHHRAECAPLGPVFIRQSFIAEKLLSADDPQVVRYGVGDQGRAEPEFRALSEAEVATRATRAAVREGAMDFVRDAMQLRTQVLPDFEFPPELAMSLFAALVEGELSEEREIIGSMVLDDHYCGRGLVS